MCVAMTLSDLERRDVRDLRNYATTAYRTTTLGKVARGGGVFLGGPPRLHRTRPAPASPFCDINADARSVCGS